MNMRAVDFDYERAKLAKELDQFNRLATSITTRLRKLELPAEELKEFNAVSAIMTSVTQRLRRIELPPSAPTPPSDVSSAPYRKLNHD
jgi:hypothetical protein